MQSIPVEILEYNENIFCKEHAEVRALGCAAVHSFHSASFAIFAVPCDLILPMAGFICHNTISVFSKSSIDLPKFSYTYSPKKDYVLSAWIPNAEFADLSKQFRRIGFHFPLALFNHTKCLDHTFILDCNVCDGCDGTTAATAAAAALLPLCSAVDCCGCRCSMSCRRGSRRR